MAILRNRLLILTGGCFLAASAAKADGVAYIDCSSHPEETQVFAKPRRTPESVAAIACGERFTVLLNGFIFSRIQTKDGQIGYIYSSLITPDHSGASVQQPASARPPATPSNPPATTATVAQPNPAAAVQVQAAPAATVQPAAAPAASSTPRLPDPAAVSAQVYSTPNSAASAQPEATPAPTAPTVPTQVQVAASQPAAAPAAQVDASVPAADVKEAPVAVAQPEATSAVQPEAAPAQPTPTVRNATMKESWERPNPVARTVGARNVGIPRLPLIELFGGFGYARLNDGAGTITNSNGVLGSFGWNIKPWLQIIADSSYNRVTVSGTKNVLYGNHWGVRYFHRLRHSWGAAPFVEGLVGGSRADTTVSGASGYSTSDTALSYKIGGGVDIHPLQHFEIRVIDFDYYRTSFGTNLHQNNYFISTGIVMRLFGGHSEQ
jgi:hypothetical protein